jgi:hypothetical protein
MAIDSLTKRLLNKISARIPLGNIIDELLSNVGGSEELEISLAFKLGGGTNAVVATRKAFLTKVGNLVTMTMEPIGKWDSSETIDTTGDRLITDNGGGGTNPNPIPVGWRPLYEGVDAPMTIRDAGTFGEGILSVNGNGSVGIAKDRQSNPFTGVIFSYYGGTVSWTIADFS